MNKQIMKLAGDGIASVEIYKDGKKILDVNSVPATLKIRSAFKTEYLKDEHTNKIIPFAYTYPEYREITLDIE